MSLVTSSLRSRPKTNGRWATGARRPIVTAMMHLLAMGMNGRHHNGKSAYEIAQGKKRGGLLTTSRPVNVSSQLIQNDLQFSPVEL
jgi:hypothetical protein